MKKIFNRNYKKVLILSSLVIILYLNFITFGNITDKNMYLNNYIDETNIRSQGFFEQNFDNIEWLRNTTFDPPVTEWYNTTEGDTSDVNATLNNNQANYEVLGEKREKQIILNISTQANWQAFNKSDLTIVPNQGYGVDDNGVWCGHDWNEDGGGQPYNTPVMHWKTNVSMDVNMSDYVITSASLRAVMKATVNRDIDTPGDTQARWDPYRDLNQYVIYDYAQFYVEVSDMDVTELNTYRIAFNQTRYLGNEGPPTNYVIEKDIETKSEQAIIDALNNVLEVNSDYMNFTVVLAIYMYCEDNNYNTDRDQWEDMRIKSLNLTFTYEKKIDQFTSISWYQEGDKISGDDIDIRNATLNFKYKIDQEEWPILSPNSEIRVLINDRKHTETVKLSSANNSFQDAKEGGFDVTTLILKDVNIKTSFQLYLADTFPLGKKITVSIDNVSLKISYVKKTEEIVTDYELFLNSQDKTIGKYIIVPLGEKVNVTYKYTNTSGEFITDAHVTIETVEGTFDLEKNDILEHYNITIDTRFFQIGDNFLNLTARKDYYEDITIFVNIICSEIDTNLDEIYLNQTLTTLIAFPYGELLNITAVYKEEATGNFIDGATVQLLNGTTVLDDFTKHPTLNQYNLTINTTILGAEANTYTIFAKRDNYSAAIESIITIIQRQTKLNLTINITTQISNYDTYELQVNESINLVVKYFDYFTEEHISGATVELSGAGLSENLTEYNEEFNITLFSENLTKGFNFLTIIAQKENTMPQAISFSINLIERKTIFKLFINETDTTTTKTYVLQIGEIINIKVDYTDNQTGSFIDGATVEITGGGISATLTEYSNYYLITISAEDLTQAINFLRILAEKKNYQPQPIEFRIDVIERQTYVSFLLNQINKTLDKTMELPISDNLNITFEYFDAKTGEYINNATVQLIGPDITLNLTEYPQLQHYSLQINTQDLGFGIKFLTLVAGKTNYQSSSDALKITVRQIKTNISVISGEVVNIGVGGSHLINITIFDIDNNVSLTNVTVKYSGDLGQGDLLEDPNNPGTYQAYFENVGLGTYRIIITVTESSGYYLFEDNEVTLSSTISEGEVMLIWGSLIASIVAAITIGGYFIAYQRYLKYPKPVRKVHKFKRTLKRKSAPSVDIISRDDSFKSLHKKGLGKVSRLKPGKLEEDKLPSVDIKSEAKFEETPPTPEKKPEVKPKEKLKSTEKKDKKKGKIKLSKDKDKAKKKEQSTEIK